MKMNSRTRAYRITHVEHLKKLFLGNDQPLKLLLILDRTFGYLL